MSEILDQHVKDCIAKHTVVPPEKDDLGTVEEAFKGLNMARPDAGHSLKCGTWALILEYTRILP